jgi:hypothetical protein
MRALEKTARKRLLRRREQAQVHEALAAAPSLGPR